MSRSFKKKYYDTICSNKGDKEYRTFYHHQKRAKIKKLLKCAENEFNRIGDIEQAGDHFSKNNIDYGLKSSDKWSWPSDGGAYYMGSLESLQADFDKDVFGIEPHPYSSCKNIWEKYKHNIEILNKEISGNLYSFDWFDNLFLEHSIPLDFKDSTVLIQWLIDNQRNIIEHTYKRHISK